MIATRSSLPDSDEMFAALLARDRAYDGVFYSAIRTTGVFCSPSCRARRARRENVEFFATAEQAQRAGYRACKLCRPLDAAGAHPDWVQRLFEEVEQRGERLSDARLRELGVAPERARRYFRQHLGLTFQQWQRAARVGVALTRLKRGENALHVGLASGYESASGFRDAFAEHFGKPPGAAENVQALVAREIETPLRPMLAIASERGVCMLEFLDRKALATELAGLKRRFRRPIVPGRNVHLRLLETEISEYFAGKRRAFGVPLDTEGSAFQRAVWDRLGEIPFGQTRSYAEIARAVGRPNAVRAVGRANGLNTIAIVVPCHRVVQSDGQLCGYGGGLWRKQWLLDHERRVVTTPRAQIPK